MQMSRGGASVLLVENENWEKWFWLGHVVVVFSSVPCVWCRLGGCHAWVVQDLFYAEAWSEILVQTTCGLWGAPSEVSYRFRAVDPLVVGVGSCCGHYPWCGHWVSAGMVVVHTYRCLDKAIKVDLHIIWALGFGGRSTSLWYIMKRHITMAGWRGSVTSWDNVQ
jgi:hypothetical protein